MWKKQRQRERERDSIKQWVVGRAEGLRVGIPTPTPAERKRERERCGAHAHRGELGSGNTRCSQPPPEPPPRPTAQGGPSESELRDKEPLRHDKGLPALPEGTTTQQTTSTGGPYGPGGLTCPITPLQPEGRRKNKTKKTHTNVLSEV